MVQKLSNQKNLLIQNSVKPERERLPILLGVHKYVEALLDNPETADF